MSEKLTIEQRLINQIDEIRILTARVRQLEEENRKLTEEVRIWKHNPENEQAVIVSDATEAAFTARLEARQLKEERDSLQSQRDELVRAALGKGAVDSAPQSAHTPNKEKT